MNTTCESVLPYVESVCSTQQYGHVITQRSSRMRATKFSFLDENSMVRAAQASPDSVGFG